MKRYQPNFKKYFARKHRVISQPTRVSELDFEELYMNDNDPWEEKAQRLQARRWRKIKHQLA